MKRMKVLTTAAVILIFTSIPGITLAAAAASAAGAATPAREKTVSILFDQHPWLQNLVKIYPGTTKGAGSLPSTRVIQALRSLIFKKGTAHDLSETGALRVVSEWTKKTADEYLAALRDAPHLASQESQELLGKAEAEIEVIHNMGPFPVSTLGKKASLYRLAAIASTGEAVSDAGVKEMLRPFERFAYPEPITVDGAVIPAEHVSVIATGMDIEHTEGDEFRRPPPMYYFGLSQAARNNIKEGLVAVSPIAVPYLGGKIGLTTIILMLLEDMHNVSFSTRSSVAHGQEMSPRDFMVHDRGHYKLSSSRDHAKAWAGKLAKELMDEDKLNYVQATHVAARVTMLRYQQARGAALTLMRNAAEAYRAVVVCETQGVDERRSAKQSYNARIAALFYACHEVSYIDTTVLEATSKTAAARALLEQVVNAHPEEDPIDKLDPFNTHPVTGASSIPDGERDVLVDGLRIKRKFSSDKEKTFGAMRPDLLNLTVSATPLIIRADGFLRDGEKVNASKQTIRLTYGDALDKNALLRLAGIDVVVPDFEGDDHSTARKKAYEFIREVSTSFRKVGVEERDNAIAELDGMNIVPGTKTDASETVLRMNETAAVLEAGLTFSQVRSVLQRVKKYRFEEPEV
tara:strand:- start:35520 stop:37412 length:1893 start_codon:yes stop_codon:yes gene_type:complete